MLQRPEEHLIQTERICTVTFHNVIGIYHVVHGLAHLFNSISAHIFAVIEHELGIGILRSPITESLYVKPVRLYNVDIHMYRCSVITIFESGRYKCVGILYAIHEITASLYHSLVNQASERFVAHQQAEVIEELIPEPGIDEMSCGMLRTAYVQIDILPVFVCLASHKRLVVARIHIPQIISRRTCKTRHGAQFYGISL